MAQEWKVQCKSWLSEKEHPDGCLQWVIYTDRSYRKMQKYGHSRPEYCAFCQKKQVQARANMAVSYFSLKLKPGADISQLKMGPLGKIQHPERRHRLENKESTVDTVFGVTEDDVRNVYNWFKNPSHRVVIVIGGTGSGKSTKFVSWLAIPPEKIPEDFFTRYGQIIVGQPRRVATSGSASWTEEIIGGTLGEGGIVGFTHGGEKKADWRNLIVQKTHGQILNMIEGGDLKNVGLVMVDEAHERSLEIDSLLRNLKEQLPIHPHLRVVIASATIDAEKFCDYFGRDVTTIVEFKAERKHTYENPKTGEVDFAEESDQLPYDNLKELAKMVPSKASNLTNQVIEKIQNKELKKGDILVFMPGKREVEDTVEDLVASYKKIKREGKEKLKVQVLHLYRGLDKIETKQAVLGSERPDTIRVIVSTNIAEASVTIASLVYVVETGLAKVPVWEEKFGKTSILLTLISKANARQRWGRAGRVRDGRVFTLYTKAQYETLMPEYPKPDIQRVNLENLVMNSRATGLTNLKVGWLEEPPAAEIERAFKTLAGVNALDKDNSLTDYGRLLRRFNYSAKIVDMLLSADISGCLVEVATLVPIIRNGGIRQVLLWDRRWSAQTKYEVFQIHRALMAGCRDDVEFLLKVFLSWEIDITDLNTKDGKPKRRTPAEKQAWAKRNFVNHETLLRVAKEREEEILSTFYVHKKDSNVRAPEIGLISRAKKILKEHLENDTVDIKKDETGRYQYVSKIEPKENSLTVFSCLDTADESNMYERLLCDQFLPVNCIYEARIKNADGAFAEVEHLSKIDQVISVTEMLSDAAEEKEDEAADETSEEDEEEQKKILAQKADTKEVDQLSKKVRIGKFSFPAFIRIDGAEHYEVGQKIQVVVEDFAFGNDMRVYAVLRPASSLNCIKDFGARFKIGDNVTLKVIRVGIYPDDPEISLVTKEETSGVTIALDPEDVVFAYAKSALGLIPTGTNLNATIVDIDTDHNFIKTSVLPEVEKEMNNLYAQRATSGGRCITEAEVLEVDPEHAVHMRLNWSQPGKGLVFIVSTSIRKWLGVKKLEETVIGEKYQVTFMFHSDHDSHAKLAEFPKEAEKVLDTRIASNLKYEDEQMFFTGRMTFGVLQELLKVSKNSEFRHALRFLYWKSNQPQVINVGGNIEQLPQQFIGEVSGIQEFGVFIKTPVIGVDGLLHVFRIKPHLISEFPIGTKVEVKVYRLDKATQKVSLDLVRIVT